MEQKLQRTTVNPVFNSLAHQSVIADTEKTEVSSSLNGLQDFPYNKRLILARQAAQREIHLYLMPENNARRQRNSSFARGSREGRELFWHVEVLFLLHGKENRVQMSRCSEEMTMCHILRNAVGRLTDDPISGCTRDSDRKWNRFRKSSLDDMELFYLKEHAVGLSAVDGVQHIQVPRCPRDDDDPRKYVKIEKSDVLENVLSRRIVVEFPVFYVAICGGYDAIRLNSASTGIFEKADDDTCSSNKQMLDQLSASDDTIADDSTPASAAMHDDSQEEKQKLNSYPHDFNGLKDPPQLHPNNVSPKQSPGNESAKVKSASQKRVEDSSESRDYNRQLETSAESEIRPAGTCNTDIMNQRKERVHDGDESLSWHDDYEQEQSTPSYASRLRRKEDVPSAEKKNGGKHGRNGRRSRFGDAMLTAYVEDDSEPSASLIIAEVRTPRKRKEPIFVEDSSADDDDSDAVAIKRPPKRARTGDNGRRKRLVNTERSSLATSVQNHSAATSSTPRSTTSTRKNPSSSRDDTTQNSGMAELTPRHLGRTKSSESDQMSKPTTMFDEADDILPPVPRVRLSQASANLLIS